MDDDEIMKEIIEKETDDGFSGKWMVIDILLKEIHLQLKC